MKALNLFSRLQDVSSVPKLHRRMMSNLDTSYSDTIHVYGTKPCPFVQRIDLVLAHKDLKHKYTEIDLNSKPKNFFEVSPYGKVPVITHKGKAIYESAAIIQYIDESYPQNKLMLDDPYERAMQRIWTHFCNAKLGVSMWTALFDKQADKEVSNKKVLELLEFMNSHMDKLSKGPFFFDNRLSMPDLMFSPFLDRLLLLEHFNKLKVVGKYPRVDALWNALKDTKCYNATKIDTETLIKLYEPFITGKARLKIGWEY